MAAIRDVEVDAIEAARKSVIELTLAHQTTARVARKQAVKELFGTLLASWEAGVPFDKMAAALNASGIQIAPETLRGYFFELKRAEQLSAENAAHERAMAKIRSENEAKQRAKDLQHAREIAQAGTELVSSTRETKVEAAHEVAARAVQAARRRPVGVASTVAGDRKEAARNGNAQPGATLPASGRADATAQVVPNVGIPAVTHVASSRPAVEVRGAAVRQVQGVQVTPARIAADATVESSSVVSTAQPDKVETGDARTLDEIAKSSSGQQETTYTENLVLKAGNKVCYESGRPFDGFLSPRTLHTLRNVGKVIAPTEGRTAKDFVKMSHEL